MIKKKSCALTQTKSTHANLGQHVSEHEFNLTLNYTKHAIKI